MILTSRKHDVDFHFRLIDIIMQFFSVWRGKKDFRDPIDIVSLNYRFLSTD